MTLAAAAGGCGSVSGVLGGGVGDGSGFSGGGGVALAEAFVGGVGAAVRVPVCDCLCCCCRIFCLVEIQRRHRKNYFLTHEEKRHMEF